MGSSLFLFQLQWAYGFLAIRASQEGKHTDCDECRGSKHTDCDECRGSESDQTGSL